MSNENAFEAWSDADGNMVIAERDPELIEQVNKILDEEDWGSNSRVGRALASWAEDVQNPQDRNRQALFERDKYVTPARVYSQMETAYSALDDDVVANALDVTESLAFNRIRATSDDENEQNVWNQIFGNLELDTWIRQAWMELFTVSHYYGVRWWGNEEYRVSVKKEKRKSRKQYNLEVPTQIGFLDPMRVVPVNPRFFGGYQLAWIADEGDIALFDSVKTNVQTDDVMDQLFVSKYKPGKQEEQSLQKQGVPTDRLLLLNEDNVWRHTLTSFSYQRWPRIRLKSL